MLSIYYLHFKLYTVMVIYVNSYFLIYILPCFTKDLKNYLALYFFFLKENKTQRFNIL